MRFVDDDSIESTRYRIRMLVMSEEGESESDAASDAGTQESIVRMVALNICPSDRIQTE